MKEEFYRRCGEILGIGHKWSEPVARRTRWNTRFLGNGRYEGRGIIRWFGPNCIHLAFTTPRVNKTFESTQEVYDFLWEITDTCECEIVCMHPSNCVMTRK